MFLNFSAASSTMQGATKCEPHQKTGLAVFPSELLTDLYWLQTPKNKLKHPQKPTASNQHLDNYQQ